MSVELLLGYFSSQAGQNPASTAFVSVLFVFGGGGLLVLRRGSTLWQRGHTWRGGGLLFCGLLLLWITWWVCSRI